MTMSIFPSNEELLDVFGAAPDVFDDQQPWNNNTLDFVIHEATNHLHCRIFSQHKQCFIQWWRDGIQMVDIDVRNVDTVQTRTDQYRAMLSITLASKDVVTAIGIHIRPFIQIQIYAFSPSADL